MATFQNDAVPKYRENDIPKTVKDLRNYTFNLSEQMMFLFSNLDEDNVPELEEIKKRLTDAEGNITTILVDASGLAVQVKDNADNIASLQLTAQGLAARITTAEGNISTLELTAESLTTRIMDAEGNISTLQQTASSLTSQIGDANANISNLQQTASSLSTQISNAQGDISSLEQTANRLTTRVSNAEGDISSLTQTADGLESTVSDLDGKYTSIKQTVDSIDIEGTVNNILQNGFAAIRFIYDGNRIGEISAVNSDLFEVWAANKMHVGCAGVTEVSGNDGVEINTSYDINIYAYDNVYIESRDYEVRINSGTDITLDAGDYVYINARDYIDIDAGDESTRIWVSSRLYWTFGTGGIYFYNDSGDLINKCVLDQ